MTIQAIRESGTAVFCPAVAPPALTPERALRRLGEFSADIRATILLGPDGLLAAHSIDDEERGAELAGLVQELVEAADGARAEPVAEIEVASPRGSVFVVRRGGWTAAVVASRLALSSVMRFDLGRLLGELAAEPA